MKYGMETVLNDNANKSTDTQIPTIGSIKPKLKTKSHPIIIITHVPPYRISGSASGIVEGINPSDYKVAVYIYVSGWWTKPYWDSPLTSIENDGTWSCNIDTGGYDVKATRVTAFLVNPRDVPPTMAGELNLPSELYKISIAHDIVKR